MKFVARSLGGGKIGPKKSEPTVEKLNEEVSETLASFKDREKQEAKRFRDATDSEYWVAICFHSRADKEAFLAEHGLDHLGDKYLDGYAVSRLLTGRGG